MSLARGCCHCRRSVRVLSGADFGVLPTPSPELDYAPEAVSAHGRGQMYRMHPSLPSWEVLADDVSARNVPVSGSKRSYDYTVDEFFTDVKKRRVNPAYDTRTYSSTLFVASTDRSCR